MGTKAKVGLLVALALVVVGVVVWDKMTIEKRGANLSTASTDTATPGNDFSAVTGTTSDPFAPPADTLNPGTGTSEFGTNFGTPTGPENLGANPYVVTTPSPILPPVGSYGPLPPGGLGATPSPITGVPSTPGNGIGAPFSDYGTGSPLLPPPTPGMGSVTGGTAGGTDALTPPPTGFPESGMILDPFEKPALVEESPRIYKVQSGDSLWVIAKHEYGDGSKWEKILEANKDKLKDRNSRLKIGDELKLPAIESRSVTPTGGSDDQEFEGKQTYTVQSGDTFSSIAAHFYGDANKWKPIFEANKSRVTSAERLRVNMKLEIPNVSATQADHHLTPSPEPDPGTSYYVVVAGDTLEKIARQFYSDSKDWQKIYKANKSKMKDQHSLKIGTKLVIPEATPASSESNG